MFKVTSIVENELQVLAILYFFSLWWEKDKCDGSRVRRQVHYTVLPVTAAGRERRSIALKDQTMILKELRYRT